MSKREQLEADGYALLEGAFSAEDVQGAIAEWSEVLQRHAADEAILASADGQPFGARNLLELWPGVMDLARQPGLRELLCELLGPGAGVVRVLFFDKPPGHSWALPWHKDYNIAVAAHGPEGAFTKPTRKAGVPHVMAPYSLLSTMLTARIHLDDMTADNGPLKVLPGSHRLYSTGEGELSQHSPVAIHCRAGDVFLMRPLLTHSSGHIRPGIGSHRRIVHLECANSLPLADGYRWHRFEPLTAPND